jgi:hypothetical protein
LLEYQRIGGMPMSEKIQWTLDVQVTGGPRISESRTMTLEAYDKLEVLILDGTEAQEIQVQPGESLQVQFLLISSNQYGPQLSYSVNSEEPEEANRIKLDAPQVLAGEGGMGLLGDAPKKLYFYNSLGSGKDASVAILVGRNVTSV